MFFTILLWIFIVVLFGTGLYVIWNLLKKVEAYEDFCRELQTELIKTLGTIKAVDLKGAFEADDEVGDTFITIKNLVLKLEVFLRGD